MYHTFSYKIFQDILEGELKQIVSDHLAEYNVRGIGVLVAGPRGMMQLRVFVGLKKYTSDSSSTSSTLFGNHFGFLGDVDDGTSEINKFEWACLASSNKVNLFKEKHHKAKFEENLTTVILPPVKDDDAQRETISVYNTIYILFCLMSLVLDKVVVQYHQCYKIVLLPRPPEFCRVVGTLAKDNDSYQ